MTVTLNQGGFLTINLILSKMVLSVVALMSVQYLRLMKSKHFVKKYNKFFSLFYSQIRLKNCCEYSTEKNNDIFDAVQIKKYLIFLADENTCCNHHMKNKEVIELLKDKMSIEKEIKTLGDMLSEGDRELEKLIESDKKKYLENIEEIKDKLLNLLTSSNDEIDNRNVELRIEQGIGGEESRLFSEDLFQMYINYANFKNWEYSRNSKEDNILISGDFVFGHLKYEAGVHRVQRVPETERSGRTHTSTCCVIVLPQPKPHEVQIKNNDLIIETLKSSGPGGQNVNKRESRVRIKHKPTGIVIDNQTERFQNENLKKAIYRLRCILFQMELKKVIQEHQTLRKKQAGSSDYSDKIRTYQYSQNRVTDHRINHSMHNLKGFLEGNEELDFMISKVKEFTKKKELLLYVENFLQSSEYKNYEKNQRE